MKIYKVSLIYHYDDFNGGGKKIQKEHYSSVQSKAKDSFDEFKSEIENEPSIKRNVRHAKLNGNFEEQVDFVDTETEFAIREKSSMIYWGMTTNITEIEMED